MNTTDTEQQIEAARKAHSDGDLKQASQLYESLIEYHGTAHLHNQHGQVLDDLGETEAALSAFQRSVAIEANYPALYNAGSMLLKTKRPQEALEYFDRALELKPDSAEAWINRGIAYFKQTEVQAAHDSIRRGLDLDPKQANGWRCLAIALDKLEQPENAVEARRKVAELTPQSPRAWYELIQALSSTPDRQEIHWEDDGRDWQVVNAAARLCALQPAQPYGWATQIQWLERLTHGMQAAGSLASDFQACATRYVACTHEAARRFPDDEWFAEQAEEAQQFVDS